MGIYFCIITTSILTSLLFHFPYTFYSGAAKRVGVGARKRQFSNFKQVVDIIQYDYRVIMYSIDNNFRR